MILVNLINWLLIEHVFFVVSSLFSLQSSVILSPFLYVQRKGKQTTHFFVSLSLWIMMNGVALNSCRKHFFFIFSILCYSFPHKTTRPTSNLCEGRISPIYSCDFPVPRFLDQMLKFEEGKAARHNPVISYDNIMSCLRICSHLCENHEFYEK